MCSSDLSERAVADSKPELIINTDDVMCSHGSATGDLDANQVFYLRSRSIDEAEARAMLVEAFVSELVQEVPDHTICGHLSASLGACLPGALSEAA